MKNLKTMIRKMNIRINLTLTIALLFFQNCYSGKDNKGTENLLLLSLLNINNGSSYTSNVKVSLYAGSSLGQSGATDGDRMNAKFNRPWDIVYASSIKSLFIAEMAGKKIRKIDEFGSVSTFAGSGIFGNADGVGTNAQFKSIESITRCPDGNIYVTDSIDERVRKVSETGEVTTITGGSGNVDGNLSTARFGSAYGITCDTSGNLFVADGGNHSIRKIDTSGNVTTYAGSTTGVSGLVDGVGNSARFLEPRGINFDPISGNLYVLGCCGSFAVIEPSRKVTFLTKVLGYVNGNINQAKFSSPIKLANDVDGDLIIADSLNNALRKFTRGGEVSTFAGTTIGEFGLVDGYGIQARFNEPSGIAAGEGRTFFVSDNRNNIIRKIEY